MAIEVVLGLVAFFVMALLIKRVRLLPLSIPAAGTRPIAAVGSTDVPGEAIAVVIPARNEELQLPLLLGDLASQTLPATEILVIDDESTDRTATLATNAGATVVMAPTRPSLWNPKVWALVHGASSTTSPTLVFLDADVRLAPLALASLTADLTQTGGLLSVAPNHFAGSAIEAFSAPANIASTAAAGPVLARHAHGAVGSCIAISRKDYDAIGGHAAKPDTIVDDLELARSARRHNVPVTMRRGGALISMRSYPDGCRAVVDGWSKNLAAGLGSTPPAASVVVALWITTLLFPLSMAAQGRFALAAICWAIAAISTTLLGRLIGRFNPLMTSLLAPVLAVVFAAITVRSLFLALTKRPVLWKDRPLSPAGLELPLDTNQ